MDWISLCWPFIWFERFDEFNDALEFQQIYLQID